MKRKKLSQAMLLVCGLCVFASPASAATLLDRALYIDSATPNATTSYTVSFTYATVASLGSIVIQFCEDPIVGSCVVPPGLDLSNAELTGQTGVTGFILTQPEQAANEMILERGSTTSDPTPSTYTFDNIVNPNASVSFAVLLSTYSSSDGSGAPIDTGSIVSQVLP